MDNKELPNAEEEKERSWTERLFADIVGNPAIANFDPPYDAWKASRPDDWETALLHTIESLPERLPGKAAYKDILLLRYKERLPFREMGKRLDISYETAHQLLVKALRLISHPGKGLYILVGEKVNPSNYADELLRMRQMNPSIAEYISSVERYVALFMPKGDLPLAPTTIFDESNAAVAAERQANLEDILGMHISELNMSVRSMHGLVRHGIYFVRDIVDTPLPEIENLHSVGAKSFAEIVEKMKSLGFGVNEEEQRFKYGTIVRRSPFPFLFCGKEIEFGEWVYGEISYVMADAYIRRQKAGDPGRYELIHVDPDSVGMFTGVFVPAQANEIPMPVLNALHAAFPDQPWSGKPVFTGDVVRFTDYLDFDIQATVKYGKYKINEYGRGDGTEAVGAYYAMDSFTRPDWAKEDGASPEDWEKTLSPLSAVIRNVEIIDNLHGDRFTYPAPKSFELG